MIFKEIGQPLQIKAMGRFLLSLGGLFIPEAREMVEMAYEFEKPFVVESQKFVQAFGNHATPLREGIRKTVAWYRQYEKQIHA